MDVSSFGSLGKRIEDGDEQIIFIVCYFTYLSVEKKTFGNELLSDCVIHLTVKDEVVGDFFFFILNNNSLVRYEPQYIHETMVPSFKATELSLACCQIFIDQLSTQIDSTQLN